MGAQPGSTVSKAAPQVAADRLRVSEIFRSIQGEADAAGWPSVFVRLTGCPLRCTWCDTAYAFQGGEWRDIDDIVAAVAAENTHHVCVTGGEPLAQKRCLQLLERLCDGGHEVSLETSGALDIGAVDTRVRKVMDLKAPGSGEADRNLWSNLEHLGRADAIKIVVADRADYEWARRQCAERDLARHCPVLFSPVAGKLEPRQLADWILADRLPVRFQMQLHKLLWGDQPGK